MNQPRRILVMRYRFIGDTLLTVPFLRNLRRQYPDAKIDMLVGPNSGELLAECPYIDELIFFDTTRKHRYENTDEPRKSFWNYVWLLRERDYDTAFVLKRSLSSAALAFLAGIPQRIGFNTEGRGLLLTTRVPYTPDIHEVESFLNVLRAADIPVTDAYLEHWQSEAEISRAKTLMAEFSENRNMVLHLTSSNTAKQWRDDASLNLAKMLLNHDSTLVLHSLGAPSDRGHYKALVQRLPEALQPRWKLWCGELALNESMALLSRMDLVVGVDSGTLHMAAAAGTPVVALFGPMNPAQWAPPGAVVVSHELPCRPCNLKITCDHEYPCMRELQAETVYSAIQRALEQADHAIVT